jgi:hypothetical protein
MAKALHRGFNNHVAVARLCDVGKDRKHTGFATTLLYLSCNILNLGALSSSSCDHRNSGSRKPENHRAPKSTG